MRSFRKFREKVRRADEEASMQYLRQFSAVALLIACFVILYPSGVFAQECDAIDILVTTTPAPPSTADTWKVHLSELKSSAGGVVDLVLIGDSLAQAWDAKMFLPMRVVNLGVGGDKTQEVLWRLAVPAWSKLKPRKVLIILGTNNLSAGDKPCAISAGLSKVIKRVASIWHSAQIGFLEIPPRGRRFLELNDYRIQVNAAVRLIRGVKTINVDDEITCGWRDGCPNYSDDGLHFSEAGYLVILNSVKKALLEK